MNYKYIFVVVVCLLSITEAFLFQKKTNATTIASSTATRRNLLTSKFNKSIKTSLITAKRVITTKSNNIAEQKINATKYQKYKVIKISDGDTVTAYGLKDLQEIRIRFKCVDAPEKSQAPWGDISLKKLIEFIPINSKISLESASSDIYHRVVAEVINHDGVNINKKMLELGMTVFYPYQSGCKDYKLIEEAAKKKKSGIWTDNKFELPWEYRRRNGVGVFGHATRVYKQKN